MEPLIIFGTYFLVSLVVMGILCGLSPKKGSDDEFITYVIISLSWVIAAVLLLIIGPFYFVKWLVEYIK